MFFSIEFLLLLFLPKEVSTYYHFKKFVLENEMSFRNPASSHLNDNV